MYIPVPTATTLPVEFSSSGMPCVRVQRSPSVPMASIVSPTLARPVSVVEPVHATSTRFPLRVSARVTSDSA